MPQKTVNLCPQESVTIGFSPHLTILQFEGFRDQGAILEIDDQGNRWLTRLWVDEQLEFAAWPAKVTRLREDSRERLTLLIDAPSEVEIKTRARKHRIRRRYEAAT